MVWSYKASPGTMLDLEGHHYSHLHLMPWVEHQLHIPSVASVFSGFDWLEQAVYVDSTVLFSMERITSSSSEKKNVLIDNYDINAQFTNTRY